MCQPAMTPDDPRLSAFVLGELTPVEATEVEAALAESAELRRVVDELREVSTNLFAALQAEPVPTAKIEPRSLSARRQPQRSAVPSSIVERPFDPPAPRSGAWLATLLPLGLLALLGVGLQSWTGSESPSARSPLVASSSPSSQVDGLAVLDASSLSGLSLEERELERLSRARHWGNSSQPPDAAVTTGPASQSLLRWGKLHDGQSIQVDQGPSVAFTVPPVLPGTYTNSAYPHIGLEAKAAQAGTPSTTWSAIRPVRRQSGVASQPGEVRLRSDRELSIPAEEQRGLGGAVANSNGADFIASRDLTESLVTQVAQQPADAYYAGHRFMFMDDFGSILVQQPDGESYAPIIENDFTVPTGELALSTFALDVDTASYSNVRRFLTQQQLPPPDAVRLEELVNYFDYDLPQPEGKDPFSLTVEATSCPWEPTHRLVRVGLQGKTIAKADRPLTRLVFLIDVSGSMSDANKLPLVQESLKLLVEQLGENDRIAIVTYSDDALLKLDSTLGSDRDTILAAIDSLSAGGSTNGAGGIQLAYEVATKHLQQDAANRVILCTDGDFNVGVSSDDELVKMIEEKRKTGVFLSVFGFGMGNIKDSKLEGLADKGNGHYGYIDDLDEARKVFHRELTGTLYTIAKDVKLQVEFNPAKVAAYRLLGYENRALAAADFNNDAVDAGELGAGHSVTAMYEIVPKGGVIPVATESTEDSHPPAVDPLRYQQPQEGDQQGNSQAPGDGSSQPAEDALNSQPSTLDSPELLTVKVRYKQPDGDDSTKLEVPLNDEPVAPSQDLQFAAAVTGFGLLLRNSEYAAGCNWDLVVELAEAGTGIDPAGERAEFVDLARQARRLWNALHPEGRHYRRPAQMTATEAVTGSVTLVSGNEFATLSIGRDDGVREGTRFTVVRIVRGEQLVPRVIGELRVVAVEADQSVGQLTRLEPGEQLQSGDIVTPASNTPR
ncbi:MAG: von Willebrand factor type A domain-containing protein [Planctomycetaceae bacterium]